jgi:hypothetical protein
MRRSSDEASLIGGLIGFVAIAFWLTFMIHTINTEKWLVLLAGVLVPPFGTLYGLLYLIGIVP